MSEVPTMAIDEVEITKNDSAMYDEILAHRLGLVPLKTDLKMYSKKGKGPKDVNLTLKAVGPGYVYSEDLKSRDPVVVPVFGKMPLTYLDQGKELELSCKAILGTGKEHAKFSPCHVTYKSYPKVEMLGQPKNAVEFMNVCPKKVFSVDNETVKPKNLEQCDMCMLCAERYPEMVRVGRENDRYIFELESWGQLEPTEILETARDTIISKAKELASKIS
jgi:DNA-directed RNA polymerase subunit D